MKVERTLSADLLNSVANHPEVHPWLGAEGEIDLTEVIGNPANFALCTEGGGFLCVNLGSGVYDVHSLFHPDHRKGRTLPFMQACMAYMFTRTDCTELVTKLPEGNTLAASLASVGGFTPRFRTEAAWLHEGRKVAVDHVGLAIEQWAVGDEICAVSGEHFHAVMDAAMGHLSPPAHPDDPHHDHIAGAAYLMATSGNPYKAVVFYNKWAARSGYATIGLVSVTPPVIDVSDGGITLVLEAGEDGLEILLCR